MLKVMHMEIKRAFRNRFFYFAVLLGCSIVALHIVLYVIPAPKITEEGLRHGQYPLSLFNRWIGFMFTALPTSLFYFLFPVIAALPFGDSYFIDKKSGFIQNICVRTKKQYYYLSKYISVFISGGTAVVIPLVLDLWITAMIVPAVIPDASTGLFPIMERSMWSSLFYSHPYLYTLGYIVIDFIFGGLFATLALASSCFIYNRFVILLMPFLLYMAIFFITDINFAGEYNIHQFLKPSQPTFANPFIIAIFAILLFTISILIYRTKGCEKDVF